MPRLVVRERGGRPGALAGTVFLGFALGTVAGWALGELLSPTALRDAITPPTRGTPSMAELVRDAQDALVRDPLLEGMTLEILPVSRQRVELHGWVPTRRLRSHAYRIACQAVGSDAVINCLLVRGEDDAPDTDAPDALSA